MDTLSTNELAKQAGVSTATISYWTTKGLPFVKNGKSRVFQRQEVIDWLQREQMDVSYSFALTKDKSAPKNKNVEENIAAMGDILERLRGVEAFAYQNYEDADTLADKAYWAKEHRDASEQLRKYEKDWAMIQHSMGRVISKEEHEKIISYMCSEVRQRLDNLPNTAAAMCENMHSASIFEVLADEVRKVIKALHEG